MAEIKCYTYDSGTLTKVGIIDDFISFSFQRSYSNIGEWTLVLKGDSLNTSRVKGMQIISLDDGIAGLVYKSEEIKTEEEYTITYTGYELKSLALQRIIIPESGSSHQTYSSVTPDYVIEQLLDAHIVNPTDTDREITSTIDTYTAGTESINFSGRFQNVSEAIQTIANTYGIGWYADIQSDAIVWHIYRGTDRKKSQSTNSRMVVSYALDSIGNSSLANINLMPNFALVAGQGEGTDRDTTTVGTSTDISRSELYVDARDLENSSELSARGTETLASYGDSLTYDATFSSQFINLYRNPYELGDIGTIIDERLTGGEVDFRLTEITEVYESDNFRLDATFGYDRQGLAETISRSTGNTQALISSEGSGGISEDDITNIVNQAVTASKLAIYPVGAVYISVDDTSPATLFGGTWTAFATGRTLVGIDTGDSDFDTVEEEIGSKTHTLTSDEMPSHTHTQDSHTHSIEHNHASFNSGATTASHTHSFSDTSSSAGGHYHEIWWGTDRPISLSSGNTGSYGVYSSSGYRTGYSSGSVYRGAMNAKAVSNHTHSVSGTTGSGGASHTHSVNVPNYTGNSGGTVATNQTTGGGSAHNNIQPSIVVYMWKRTA